MKCGAGKLLFLDLSSITLMFNGDYKNQRLELS